MKIFDYKRVNNPESGYVIITVSSEDIEGVNLIARVHSINCDRFEVNHYEGTGRLTLYASGKADVIDNILRAVLK